jgi:bacterial/archaeal transporter family-2 protein
LSLPGRWQGNEHIAAKTARTVVWAYLLIAFAAGAVLPFQAGINAELAEWLHSPVRAAFVSFLTGALILLVAAALVFKPLPSWERLGHAPWWVWVGGALGAFYVAASIVSAPKLGAATLIALVVAGQGLTSLVVDHYGWVGFEAKHISAGRIAGMALVGVGVALVRVF